MGDGDEGFFVSEQFSRLSAAGIARNLGWAGISRVVLIVLQVIVTAVLARLLSPQDFGLLGMATVFTGFLQLFNDVGFGKALIQFDGVDHILIESCLWANLGVGIGLTLLAIFLSPVIGWFYHSPEVAPLLIALGFNFPIVGLGIVQLALLERQLDYRKVATIELGSTILAAVLVVGAAWAGLGVWSLVIQIVGQSLTQTVLAWHVIGFVPDFVFSWSRLRGVIGFSSNLTAFNVVNYFARNADYLLIGRFLGGEALGLYTMAYNLMLFPSLAITRVFGRVLFPVLSRAREDMPRFRRIYLQACLGTALVTFPMMVGLFGVSQEFVSAGLGLKWTPIIPVVRLLAWVGLVQSIAALNGAVYLSLGKLRLRFWIGLVLSTFSVAGIIVGVSFGNILTIAIGYTVASVVALPIVFLVPLKLMHLSVRTFVKSLLPILLCSLIMLISILVIRHILSNWVPWACLAVETGVGVLVYVLAVRALLGDALMGILETVKEALGVSARCNV